MTYTVAAGSILPMSVNVHKVSNEKQHNLAE